MLSPIIYEECWFDMYLQIYKLSLEVAFGDLAVAIVERNQWIDSSENKPRKTRRNRPCRNFQISMSPICTSKHQSLSHRRRPLLPPLRRVESEGVGVTSSILPIFIPERARARKADCAPGPGVLVPFPKI